jgi:hypothetical protein
MPRKPGTFIVWSMFWIIMACGHLADGQKYKGSAAVMVAVGLLLFGIWPTLKAKFRAGLHDT